MQENHLFEYAVIRIVPQVEREEFINTGVVLYCPKQKFLRAEVHLDTCRLKSFCVETDLDELQGYITAFIEICSGSVAGGPIGKLSLPERFRWLTARRSTIIQTSMVHPGLCPDADVMLMRLYSQLVSKIR